MTTSRDHGAGAGELLPCPFCGGPAELHLDQHPAHSDLWRVECEHAFCAAWQPYLSHEDRDAVVAAWNTRAQPSNDLTAGRGEEAEVVRRLSEIANRYPGDPSYLVAVAHVPDIRAVLALIERLEAKFEAKVQQYREALNRAEAAEAKLSALVGGGLGVVGSLASPGPSPSHAPAASDTGEGGPHVFLDCDGVLADFDAHGLAYFGKPPRQAEVDLGAKEFWRQLEARGDFYRSMPLMPDARALYEGVKHLHPTILTGCPRGTWAQGQKVAWAAEHFPGVPIITCRSADKRDYAKPGDVLIDDWPQHRHRWIEHGGIFITHHDAATSLAALWAHYPALASAKGPAQSVSGSVGDVRAEGEDTTKPIEPEQASETGEAL